MLRVTAFSNRRQLLQHPRSLPDRQPDAGPVLDGFGEYVPRLVEIVAGVEHALAH